MNTTRFVLLFLVVGLLSACSTFSGKKNGDAQVSERELYVTGERALADQKYDVAIEKFEAINTQYPYGDFTQQAQTDLIYAYYKSGDYTSAAAAADHFIHLYPRASKIDYVYYMQGVANFEEQKNSFTRYLPVDSALRDVSISMTAYNNFVAFIIAYPRSQYVADAKERLVYLRNMFAGKELAVANYYFERKQYVAAANRASHIVKTYQQSPQVEQALVMMVKANRLLGMKKAAADALLVLKTNFPASYKQLA